MKERSELMKMFLAVSSNSALSYYVWDYILKDQKALADRTAKPSADSPTQHHLSRSENYTNYQTQNRLYQYPTVVNAMCGGASGFVSGLIVAPGEAIKVRLQQGKSVNFLSPSLYKEMLSPRLLLPFASLFSAVCTAEFSVNDSIRARFGDLPGVIASSLTGAAILTPADHLLLRQDKTKKSALDILSQLFKQRKLLLWTGATSMVAREAVFVTSVMYTGPAVGNYLKTTFSDKSQDNWLWTAAGRLCTGMVTSLISHPFDVLTRSMQLKTFDNPTVKPKIIETALERWSYCKNQRSLAPFFAGAGPRIALATVGGALVGGFFDKFKQALVGNEQNTNNKPAPSPKP